MTSIFPQRILSARTGDDFGILVQPLAITVYVPDPESTLGVRFDTILTTFHEVIHALQVNLFVSRVAGSTHQKPLSDFFREIRNKILQNELDCVMNEAKVAQILLSEFAREGQSYPDEWNQTIRASLEYINEISQPGIRDPMVDWRYSLEERMQAFSMVVDFWLSSDREVKNYLTFEDIEAKVNERAPANVRSRLYIRFALLKRKFSTIEEFFYLYRNTQPAKAQNELFALDQLMEGYLDLIDEFIPRR